MNLLALMGNLREGYELTLIPSETDEATELRVELLELSGLVTITHSGAVRTVRWKMDLSPGEEEDHLMDGIVKFKNKGGIIGRNTD